jgi:hypothetical protein
LRDGGIALRFIPFVVRVFELGFLADFLSQTIMVEFLTGVGFQVGVAMLGVSISSNWTVRAARAGRLWFAAFAYSNTLPCGGGGNDRPHLTQDRATVSRASFRDPWADRSERNSSATHAPRVPAVAF